MFPQSIYLETKCYQNIKILKIKVVRNKGESEFISCNDLKQSNNLSKIGSLSMEFLISINGT